MTAELSDTRFVRFTLEGRPENRAVLDRLLTESPAVIAHDITAEGVLTAFVEPAEGEFDVVRALLTSGMYPREAFEAAPPELGGPRAC